MNRINPLYILSFTIVILIFSIIELKNAKLTLQETKDNYKQKSILVDELVDLKNAYSSKKDIQKIVNGLHVEKKFKKSSVKITSDSMNLKTLNSLMGKVLNNSYNISSLEIKKINKTNVKFSMEIKW